jgi:hypothetical protein
VQGLPPCRFTCQQRTESPYCLLRHKQPFHVQDFSMPGARRVDAKPGHYRSMVCLVLESLAVAKHLSRSRHIVLPLYNPIRPGSSLFQPKAAIVSGYYHMFHHVRNTIVWLLSTQYD